MSKDFIVFDLADTEFPHGEAELLEYVDLAVGVGEEYPDEATEKVEEILNWAGGKFGSTLDADSQWASWPPSVLAEGRHCTFNLCPTADSMTFMMLLCQQCQRLGLLMIDPSGRKPFITIPGGGGLLD